MNRRAHSAITVALLALVAPLTYLTAVATSHAQEVTEQKADQRTKIETSVETSNRSPAERKQSSSGPSNTELLTEELRDTETRRQNELDARVQDIEAQAETIRQLTQRQAEYIEQLKAKIDALEAQGAAE